MSNYNQLKITYQGGQETAITLTSSTIVDFEYQDSDIISVEVPEIVEAIGDYAFCDNNGLSSIVLNEGLQTIGNQAFQHGLYTAVTIPSTVTSIGMNAFNMNHEQSQDEHPFTVTCLAATPPTLYDYEGITFGNPEYLQAIYVPAESVDAYKAASVYWEIYASKIQAIPEPPKPVRYIRYIQSFETAADWYGAYADNKLGTPSVVYLEDEQRIVWNEVPPTPPEPVYSAMPLTLEIVQGGTITFRGYSSWLEKNVIECSRDNGETWTTLTPTAEGTTIRVSKGEKLILKGHNSSYARANAFCKFDESTAHFNVYGNIMSLIDYDNYMTLNSLTDSYVFTCMFRACKIHNVDIYLPATALTPGCYQGLFELNAETNYYQKVKITCLATDITAEDCTRDWLRGVLPTKGTFVKHPNTTWTTGESGIPAGWTVEDANI